MRERIIPGVSVSVVKEVVPPQLAPSGVLGLIGLTEKTPEGTERASSMSRFVEVFGRGSAFSMPEARQALANGVFELVVCPVENGLAAKVAIGASSPLQAEVPATTKNKAAFSLIAKAAGDSVEALEVDVKAADAGFDVSVTAAANPTESYAGLSMDPDSENYVEAVLSASKWLMVAEVGDKGLTPKAGKYTFTRSPAIEDALTLTARSPGIWANGLKVQVTPRTTAEGIAVFDLSIQRPGSADPELHRNLSLDPHLDSRDVVNVLKANSDLALAKVKADAQKAGISPVHKAGDDAVKLAGGKEAAAPDYLKAIEKLKDEPDVDMVLAAVQDFSNLPKVIKIYGAVISHCQLMAEDSKGRIGFGQLAQDMKPGPAKEMVGNLVSDRFVLVAPNGVAGAMAGRVGGLSYFQSPTFKNVGGLGAFASRLTVEDQRALLKAYVVPVVKERGRGIIVLRGLTTDGDQINVRRVADRAVRGVKMIGDLFIGRLNTEDGRNALKQKLVEFLTQMERDSAIVPSTDGTDPAFKVDVYSSQADFAKGIVRVDMAVRPVRAIDYIYATVLVQV